MPFVMSDETPLALRHQTVNTAPAVHRFFDKTRWTRTMPVFASEAMHISYAVFGVIIDTHTHICGSCAGRLGLLRGLMRTTPQATGLQTLPLCIWSSLSAPHRLTAYTPRGLRRRGPTSTRFDSRFALS